MPRGRSWFGVVVFVALGASASGCGSSAPRAAPPSSPASTTTSTTSAPSTTSTTVWVATSPQASPDAAAARLVSAWSSGNRPAALAVAMPDVVAALFAVAYPNGYLQARGCQEGVTPGTCTYRDTETNRIFEIQVTSGPSGWYVSSVTAES